MTTDVLKILRWMVIGWAGALYLGTCLALCIAGCSKTLSFLPPTSKTYRKPIQETKMVYPTKVDQILGNNTTSSNIPPGAMVFVHFDRAATGIPAISMVRADRITRSAVLGVALEEIAAGTSGKVALKKP